MQSELMNAMATASAGEPAAARLAAGPGFSLTDIARFEAAMRAPGAGAAAAVAPNGATLAPRVDGAASVGSSESGGLKAVVATLDQMNSFAQHLGQSAHAIQAKGEMSPGDMLMLTVRCQELLFYCELTANVANRSSEGVQQLFRQQS